ncbi:hypothetical protein J1N35_022090 [Gossypium stocksii]|uniref:Uncharacterized protein n=1 Tax=Gossypium stocksii TaxID=47602 RepID=A0A9D4A340_9ROSI|nr:hypothetical protein J1N35_022090 [Gossypium stocksii]
MSRKRTRSSKTSVKNPIVIQDEELVREFYANLTKLDAIEILVCKKKAQVRKSKPKGPYVQACITTRDLERLVENILELNRTEPNDPTEPEIDESLNNTEMEANSVTEIEKVEYEEEPSDPDPIKELEVSEPREESNVDEPVELSVGPELTIHRPTSSNIVKKSKLLIMMDMMKFMHNKQQNYWKYAKIRHDSVRNTFRNISNNFVPQFPDHIFES